MNNVVVGIVALFVCLLQQGYSQDQKELCRLRSLPERTILPYLALLYTAEDIYICGGSMIHYRMVLTAAHCLEDNTTLVVRVGDNLSVTGEKHSVDAAFRHHLYDPKTHENDLAILRLTSDSPICFFLRPTLYVSDDYTVAGWVPSEKDSGSVELMDLETSSRPPRVCGGFSRESNLMCAGNSDSNQCNVVSGGPLVQNTVWPRHQMGIASYSSEKCRNETVYTRLVQKHIDWIHRVLRKYGEGMNYPLSSQLVIM